MSDDLGNPPVRIGASGVWVGVVSAVVLLIAAGGLVWFGGFTQLYGIGTATTAAAVTVHTLATRRHDGVTCEDAGLVVTVRGRRAVHPWTGLLEVGWAGQGFPYTGAGLLLRPAAGGPWDTPGPNNPTQVATLAVFGRAAQRHARTVLGEQCTHHGVPFAGNGRRMLNDGPPGSPYRAAAAPSKSQRSNPTTRRTRHTMRQRAFLIPSLGVSLVGLILVLTASSAVMKGWGVAAIIAGVALSITLWRNQGKPPTTGA